MPTELYKRKDMLLAKSFVSTMASTIKDVMLVVSSVLSIVNLILLLAMFQSSLDLLQQQPVEYRELLMELQAKTTVCIHKSSLYDKS